MDDLLQSALDIAIDSVTTEVVDTAELATGAVTDVKLASGSIQNNKLANPSWTISDGAGNSTAINLGDTFTIQGTTNEVEVGEGNGRIISSVVKLGRIGIYTPPSAAAQERWMELQRRQAEEGRQGQGQEEEDRRRRGGGWTIHEPPSDLVYVCQAG